MSSITPVELFPNQLDRITRLHEILNDAAPTDFSEVTVISYETAQKNIPELLSDLTGYYSALNTPLSDYVNTTEIESTIVVGGAGPENWSQWLKPYRVGMMAHNILLNLKSTTSFAQSGTGTSAHNALIVSLEALLATALRFGTFLGTNQCWPNLAFLQSEVRTLEGRSAFPVNATTPPAYTNSYISDTDVQATYESLQRIILLGPDKTAAQIQVESNASDGTHEFIRAIRLPFPSSILAAHILAPTLSHSLNAEQELVQAAEKQLLLGQQALDIARSHLSELKRSGLAEGSKHQNLVEEVIGIGSEANQVLEQYLNMNAIQYSPNFVRFPVLSSYFVLS